MTAVWAAVTAIYHRTQCWWGYNLTPYYWVLEGPRVAVIAVSCWWGYSFTPFCWALEGNAGHSHCGKLLAGLQSHSIQLGSRLRVT